MDIEELIRGIEFVFSFITQFWFIALVLFIIYRINKAKAKQMAATQKSKHSNINNTSIENKNKIKQLLQQIIEEHQKVSNQQKNILVEHIQANENFEIYTTVEQPAKEGINYEAEPKTEKKVKKNPKAKQIKPAPEPQSEVEYWKKRALQVASLSQNDTQKLSSKPNRYAQILKNPQTLRNMFIASEIFKPKF